MRTIKFRGRCLNNGWREDGRFKDGEWVYGSYISRRSGTYIEFQDAPKSKSLHGATHCVKVDPETVGQYTGLKDKNGKEIYEGDIVNMEQWRPELAEVCFDDGAFCLKQKDIPYMSDIHYVHHAGIPQATVIGNIYDNNSD